MNLVFTEQVFVCRHHSLTTLADRFANSGRFTAIQPGSIGQVRRTQSLVASRIGTVAGYAKDLKFLLAGSSQLRICG